MHFGLGMWEELWSCGWYLTVCLVIYNVVEVFKLFPCQHFQRVFKVYEIYIFYKFKIYSNEKSYAPGLFQMKCYIKIIYPPIFWVEPRSRFYNSRLTCSTCPHHIFTLVGLICFILHPQKTFDGVFAVILNHISRFKVKVILKLFGKSLFGPYIICLWSCSAHISHTW